MEKIRLPYTPALPAAIGWPCGIIVWYYGWPWWILAISATAGIIVYFTRLRQAAFCLLCIPLGWAIAELNRPTLPPQSLFDGEKQLFTGRLIKQENRALATTLILQIDSAAQDSASLYALKKPFKVAMTTEPIWSKFAPGEIIRFSAELTGVDVEPEFSHAADFRLKYLQEGVTAQCLVLHDSLQCLGARPSFIQHFDIARQKAQNILARSNLSTEAYGLLSAILFGQTEFLEPSVRQNFRTLGIAHALALSGFHLGIILLIIYAILFPFNHIYPLRNLRFIAAIVMIWLYTMMTGLPESAVRAATMISLLLLSKIFRRENQPFNTICVAFILILIASPYSLFSAGLQLSLTAILGIYAFTEALNPINAKHHLAHTAVSYFTVSIGATLGTLALTMLYFHRVPTLFLLSNLGIALVLPLIMWMGVVRLAASALGWKWAWLDFIINKTTYGFSSGADKMAGIDPNTLNGIYISPLQAVIISAAVIVLAVLVRCRSLKSVSVTAVIFAGLICSAFIANTPQKIESEGFIMRLRSEAPVVMRHGQKMAIVLSSPPSRREGAKSRALQALAAYINHYNVDSVLFPDSTFSLGPFSGDSCSISYPNATISLATKAGQKDSIDKTVTYTLLGTQYRYKPAELMRLHHPDTLLLGASLATKKAKIFADSVAVPTIDLKHHQFIFYRK